MAVPVLKQSNTHLLEGVVLHRRHGGQGSFLPGADPMQSHDHVKYRKIPSPERPMFIRFIDET